MEERQYLPTRIPPHSIEAEESIIGAVLLDNEAFDRIADAISAEDFYVERHARVFAAMTVLADQSRPMDVVTVGEKLKQSGELQRIGGMAYLIELTERIATAANVEHYARIVRDKAVLRRLIRVSTGIIEESYMAQDDCGEIVDRAEQAVFDVSNNAMRSALVKLDQLIPPTVRHIEALFERKEEVTGVPTGFRELDRITAGFQPSDLVIIAGRPSMGKTAFCLNVAEYAAMKAGIGVAIFSLEMANEQLVLRMLCSQAELDNSKVRTGHLSDRDLKKLALTAGGLGTAPIYIDDAPSQNVNEIRAKARRLKNDKSADLGLVIVDYLQLMRGNSSREGRDNREQEISTISRSLKALAKELGVPVIALSQLNRQVELRADKRPLMADLRESGAIEQDADVIGFIYRDEVYNPDSPDQGIAEIIIAKQRNGPIGNAKVQFDRQFARFSDLSYRDDPTDYGDIGEPSY